MAADSTLTVADLTHLADDQWATLVFGSSRSMANRLLFSLASRIDPKVAWVEFQERFDEAGEKGPVELGWVPEDQMYRTRLLEQAKPQAPPNPSTGAFLLQLKQASQMPRSFLDYYRLPELTRTLVNQAVKRPRPRIIAYGSSELVRQYYPQDPDGVRSYIEPFLDAGVHPMWSVAGSGTPSRAIEAMDFVFVIESAKPGESGRAVLRCVRAPEHGPVTKGSRAFVEDLLLPSAGH